MSTARFLLERFAKQTTGFIGARWGETFPFYYVSEFPKSGGTWLARMVSDYLQLPFPQHTIFPIGTAAVLQNHWNYDPRLRRVFYLYRDGRDVMTSLFFDRVRVARHSDRPGRDRLRRRYERLLGEGYDPHDTVRLLPRFMEHEFAHPGRGARVSWQDHIDDWVDQEARPHIAYLSYEGLLSDCKGTLSRALAQISGGETDLWRLERSIEKYSMKRQTGRSPGEEDLTQHIRKGVAGDWLSHFSRESAEMFKEFAGEALVKLGYEEDHDWIDRYEYQTG